jgi:hypothetical protein
MDLEDMLTFLTAWFLVYWLPTLIAIVRRTPSAAGVAMLNFFAFLVIPWFMALLLALAAHPAPERVIIVEGRAREI